MAAKLQCEICGGKLVGKPGGIFECDSCGTEYSTEWAKAKIQEIKGTVKVEGTVEVTGKVQIDGAVKVENGGPSAESLIKRGMMELEALEKTRTYARKGEISPYDLKKQEVKDYFNRALEIDPENGGAYWGLFLLENKYYSMEIAARHAADRISLPASQNYERARSFAKGETLQAIQAFENAWRQANQSDILPPEMKGIFTVQNGTLKRMPQQKYSGETVQIPEGICRIEPWAFRDCKELRSVSFPQSLTEIGEYAFEKCTGLSSLRLPDALTRIGRNAFEKCTGITSLDIPEGVTKIEQCAFMGCTGLTSLSIPEGVTTIEQDAFRDLTGLTEIAFPSSLQHLGGFQGCTGLKEIRIPESVSDIYSAAFSGCTGLTSLTFPKGLRRIYDFAFSGCTGLTSVSIPAMTCIIDSIPSGIFSGAFSGCSKLTVAVIPPLYNIYTNAFQNCPIRSLTIPEGTETIERDAFEGCRSLETVTIPSGVTKIESCAFKKCNLLSLELPEGVEEIGSEAFNGCRHLTITIPSSVTKIGNRAFGEYEPDLRGVKIRALGDSFAAKYAQEHAIAFERIKTAEELAAEEAARKAAAEKAEAERKAKIEALNAERTRLQSELSNLKGLFTGKRRREIETRLTEIEADLKLQG